MCPRVEDCGTVVECGAEESEQIELVVLRWRGAGVAEVHAERREEITVGEQEGGVLRRPVIEARGGANGLEQVAREEPHGKLQRVGLGEEAVAGLGEDQGVDAGGDEIGEQVVDVSRRGGRGHGRAQLSLLVDDDGGKAPAALPQCAAAHGRNSSRAVCTCSALTWRALAKAAAESA